MRTMVTLNETSDCITEIQQAKIFLKEYPEETITTVAGIFKLPQTSLSASIHNLPTRRRDDHNQILTPDQE